MIYLWQIENTIKEIASVDLRLLTTPPHREILRKTEKSRKRRVKAPRLKAELSIPLDFFAKKNEIKLSAKEIEDIRKNVPREAFGFLDNERLNTAHHTDHAKKMGYKDQKSYERGAVDFWKNGNGKIYYSPVRDRYYKYDEKKNLFSAVDKDGVTHTFMIMDNNTFLRKQKQEQLYDNL